MRKCTEFRQYKEELKNPDRIEPGNILFIYNLLPVSSLIYLRIIISKFLSISPGLNTKEFILPGETVEGLREFDFAEITPGIVPLTQDLSAFARRLKATLGEEEKDNIRLTIHNIESLTAELDTFVYNYRNIISDNDKKNFQDFIKNLSGAVKD